MDLVRIYIQHETSLLSQQYLVQPREGHLAQTCNIFQYLKHRYQNGYFVMDPTKWDINWSRGRNEVHPKQQAEYMAETYPDANCHEASN